ncbi:MAG TPA: hypothetical protein DEB06_10240 [Phycisphaerales bacterium]|nr:hypothetical protein [Phycisphaerales bacterium]
MPPALKDGPVLILADGLADAQRSITGPVALLAETGWNDPAVLAWGPPQEVRQHPAAGAARTIDRRGCILLPGLVNAHTHLDLSHMGARPFDPVEGFAGWIGMVRRERAVGGPAVAESVRLGVARLLRGGVAAVGDISGAFRLEPAATLAALGLRGVSYCEFFALGARWRDGIQRAGEALAALRRGLGGQTRVRAGLQPHAPYSVGLDAFRWAVEQSEGDGMPLCTHLAESRAESTLVASGGGELVEALRSFGVWDEGVAAGFGHGATPVAHLAPVLNGARRLAAVHVNHCSDADIETLARAGTRVVYCPRASSYFHHERDFGPHRYRDMMHAGITVALGTDSIINIPPDQADRLSPLDDARLLFQRDGTDARTLLAMATVNGAVALGIDEALFRFPRVAGPIAGVIAVPIPGTSPADPARAVMESRALPEFVLRPAPGPGI